VAFINRGGAYQAKGDFDQAIADLDKALQLDPKSALALSDRASIYRARGDLDRTIADYDAAIVAQPKSLWLCLEAIQQWDDVRNLASTFGMAQGPFLNWRARRIRANIIGRTMMDIRTVLFNGVTFAFHTDADAVQFATLFDTPEKAELLAAGQKWAAAMAADALFGACPHCFKNNGYVEIGSSHIYYCKEHKVSWCAGVFDREQTEEEQRRIYAEEGIADCAEIEPFIWPLTIDEWNESKAAEYRLAALAAAIGGEDVQF
jgi:tetratricopeptide (TPR) repeat protein